MNPSDIVKLAVKTLDDRKAQDIVVLDVGDKTTLTEHFVIASANNTTHVRALAGEVEAALKAVGMAPIHTEEKERGSQWILIDYGSVIVHVFYNETRKFYGLERLWADATVRRPEDILDKTVE